MNSSLLHVVTCVFNPIRWQRRYDLYKDFEQHMLDSGVKLTVVECQLGERPYILDNPHVNHVKVRGKTVLWNKENLMNLGINNLSHTFPDWKYVCWSDADIMFRKSGWASETVHALQQYKVIQPWEICYDLGPTGEHLEVHHSFLSRWWKNQPIRVQGGQGYTFPHPGYCWAAKRSFFDAVGPLLETAALGAGDHHMALGLIDMAQYSMPGGISDGYKRHVMQWQQRALTYVNYKLGFLPGYTIEHFWHGRKADRKYIERWDIVIKNKFDPDYDIKKNVFGVIELTGNKPNLEHDLDIYFRQRNEQGNLI